MGLHGWHYWNNSCYILRETAHTWQIATKLCQDVMPSGHLAVINNEQEQSFLAKLMLSVSLTNPWLGCKDMANETWTCLDGSGMSYDENTGTGSPGSYWSKSSFYSKVDSEITKHEFHHFLRLTTGKIEKEYSSHATAMKFIG